MRALIAIITGLTVSLASFGTEKKLGAISAAAPNQTCETVLFGSQEALYHQVFSSWAQNYQDGIATRGYMGNAIANTPLSNRIALEYGILFWGIAFRLVPNVEAAQAHRQKVYEYNKKKNALLTDQIVTSIYILGDEKELNITFDAEGTGAVRKPVDPKIVKSILARGGIEISETGEITHYTGEQLQNRISANSVDFNNVAHLPSTGHMNSLSQSGWVTYKKHGIHDFEHWKS